MDGDTIKEKLRARRRAMNITAQSEMPSDTFTTADETMLENMVTDLEEPIDEEDEGMLRSALESRREKSKRKLETEERERATSGMLFDTTTDEHNVDDILSSPRSSVPSPSKGPASLGTDPESRNDTPTGRTGQHSTLRSRLQAKLASKRGGTPTSEHSLRPQRSRRLRDRIDRSTRFSESYRQRDHEEEADLIKKIESKLKWKFAAEKSKAERGEPTEAECYDFFTKQYEDVDVPTEPETPPPAAEVVAEEQVQDETRREEDAEGEEGRVVSDEEQSPLEPVEEEQPEGDGDQKKLISDIISKDLDWKLYNLTAAEYRGYHTQVELENLTYFVPSMLPPDVHNKVEDNAAPRYLEDEGFYVGEKPIVLRKNKSILENRLLRQADRGQGWFGLDGEVEILPDPVKQVPTKPWIESVEDIDVTIETVYMKAYLQQIEDKYLKGSEENELQIDIGTVVFLHHPLMSREHVMASNINQMYDEYLQRRHKNYVNFYSDKLTALRHAVVTLKDSSNIISSEGSASTAQETRIHDFMSEIRRTTRQLDTAESSERDLMRKIIEEWKEIKSIREFQGFTNTSVKLTVKREQVNHQQDRKKWEEEVESEVSERREEYEVSIVYPHQENLRKYQAQLQEWKRNRLKIKRQRKKNQLGSKENLLDASEGDDEEITIAGNIDKPQKPDKPDDFDEGRVRAEVMNSLLANRRNPGEDRISLELSNTANVTPSSGVPVGEATRRKAMLKSSIFLKIIFNGKEVFHTQPKTLTTDFKLNFGSIFRVRIAQWPESLKVCFYDAGLVMNTMFSETFLRIPDTTFHSGNVQLGVTTFTSGRVETYDHEAVGSSSPFMLRQNDTVPTSLNTQGQLISSVSWGLDDHGHVLAPKGLISQSNDPLAIMNPLKSIDPVSAIGADGIQDPESLSKWVQDSRLDPNDPDNAALIPFMQGEQEGHGFLYAPDYFRLEQLQEEFNFISDEEFERMSRFRLLEFRDKEITEFRNMTMIPSQEHEIMDSVFTTYERRIRDKDSLQALGDKQVEGGTLSAHRLEVLRYRERVKDAVLHRFYTSRHHRTFQDMVHEEQVPDISTFGASLAKVVEPRRPLKPIRKGRKKATAQTLSEGSVNILVNVVRGYNIPTRQASHTSGGTTSVQASARFAGASSINLGQSLGGADPTTKSYLVCPFVAISFQDNVVSSSVAQGPSPSWNEELQVPFSAPNNDYSAGSLQTVDDVIYIHLFDRVVEETPQRYGQEDPSLITHKIQNHWLGSFRLPFTTVYQRGKIEGTFKLTVPPVLLGYDLDKQVSASSELREQIEAQFTQLSSGTYLTIFVTLEPILKPMEPIRQKFESAEDEATLNMCASYLADCNKKFPNRNAKTTVIDLKGESVLITRYIKPLQPPLELTEGSDSTSLATAERVARFVSLIPFVSDNVTYAGICDLWSTCDQFVHMLCGDEEEHAVLLLNFFLHLGKRAYLLLGQAVPEGSTAYVLTIEESTREYYIWNASTGLHYTHTDNLCPLKSVGMLVNNQNIWFNIQAQDVPSRVRYELMRGADWKAFFTSNFPDPGTLQSVQPESLYYVNTDRAYVARLTQAIKDKLKEKIMSWRPRYVTRWNRSGESALLDILRGLEHNLFRKGSGETDHGAELLRRLGDVRFTGFPMDLPFTSIDNIVTAVRSTEVHKIQDPNVEFCLAVYVHPYPASVLAVWIYVAALVNRRRNDL